MRAITAVVVTLLAVLTAGALLTQVDDSDAEVAYTFTSGNCTVDLETRSDGDYDVRVYKTPGAENGDMATYTYSGTKPWTSYGSKLRSVVFEEGVTAIGAYAFVSCGCTEVTIPASVTKIGIDVFRFCNSLYSVTLTPGLTTINGFCDNPLLESIELPQSIRTIEEFYRCGLTTIIWPESPQIYLKNGPFMGCAFTEVVLPNGLTVDEGSFSRCLNLKSITIGKDVTIRASSQTFKGCSVLDTVIFEDGRTSLPWIGIFEGSSLKHLTIPASVTSYDNRFTTVELEEVLNLSNVDFSTKLGFQNATITDHFQSSAVIEQSEIKDVVIGKKTDAASRILLVMPALITLGILVLAIAPYLRRI